MILDLVIQLQKITNEPKAQALTSGFLIDSWNIFNISHRVKTFVVRFTEIQQTCLIGRDIEQTQNEPLVRFTLLQPSLGFSLFSLNPE